MKIRGRPTLSDVARLAGVSPATASRALARPGIVQHDTLLRVERAAESLGYVPGGVARALVSGRTMTVGVVVPTLDHAIFARAIQALQTGLAAAGYQLIVASHEYAPAEEARAVRAMLGRGVDALVLVGADRPQDTRAALANAGVPVLLLWSFDEGFPCIGFDNVAAGRMAAEHLVALGHTRFGMVSGIRRANDRARLRVDGVREALAAVGLELPASAIVEAPFTFAGGRSGFAQLMALAQRPTAIVCGNDILAVGAVFEARDRALQVPGNVSIAGIDDLEIGAHVAPPLTTVHLPTVDLGAAAARFLLRHFAGEALPHTTVLPLELVVRRSTGPCPAPVVARQAQPQIAVALKNV